MDKSSKIVHELAVSVRKLVDVSADHEKRLQEVEVQRRTKWPPTLVFSVGSKRCHNVDGFECPGAMAEECVSRASGSDCPTFSPEERQNIIARAELECLRVRIEKLPPGRREEAGAELAKLSRLLESPQGEVSA